MIGESHVTLLLKTSWCHTSIYRDGVYCALKGPGGMNGSKYILLLSNAGLFQWALIVADFQKGIAFSNRFIFKNHKASVLGSEAWMAQREALPGLVFWELSVLLILSVVGW